MNENRPPKPGAQAGSSDALPPLPGAAAGHGTPSTPSTPDASSPAGDAAWRCVFDAACAVYRVDARSNPGVRSRWAWHWARGKLWRDPVFRGMLERGLFGVGHGPAGARVVDIGCGQGLVAALLHACMQKSVLQAWPTALPGGWPPAPSARAYTGIELMARDANRGNAALHRLPFAPRIATIDMRVADIPPCDVVVILDVLHYVDHAAQDRVLEKVRDALAQGGRGEGNGAGDGDGAGNGPTPPRLLLRVSDATHQRRYAFSQWVDRIVTAVRGHRLAPTWGRTLPEWIARLHALGFDHVESVPMSQGTPFANVLLVADLAGAGAADATMDATAEPTADPAAATKSGVAAQSTADVAARTTAHTAAKASANSAATLT